MDCLVLAVNFMGAIFAGGTSNLLEYGEGAVLPIAALDYPLACVPGRPV